MDYLPVYIYRSNVYGLGLRQLDGHMELDFKARFIDRKPFKLKKCSKIKGI